MGMITQRIRSFIRDESGVLLAESLITLPLLIWVYLALFVYWDAFRAQNTAQKAAYSIADLMSRQGEIKQPFINGMEPIFNYLLVNYIDSKMRISSLQWDDVNKKFIVLFSKSPSNRVAELTNATVQVLIPDIPIMANGDSIVLVETAVDYRPPFTVGIPITTFNNFIVTRPRFYRRVCMDVPACPP